LGGYGRTWGYFEPVVAGKVKDADSKVQPLWYKKMNLDCIQNNEAFIMSVDGMHCEWKVLIEEEYIWFDV
jgi:hypothetical protein